MLGRIGKYELLRSLAVGGMAEVFLARQTGLQGFEKVVVIKKILPNLGSEARFVQMFLEEARLAARFNHPNIVQIYDLGQDHDVFFIAMEYIHGEDIKAIVRRCAQLGRRIPVEHVVKIGSSVLDGLHYAHSQLDAGGRSLGIVHRDVSPHNILLSFQGGVKLVDFGIAKARSQISTTLPGRVKGKHAYMSPEQCQGLDLDGRSDIFSVGIVMYELVTWTRLFKRKTDLETLRAIVSGDLRPPSALCPDLDPELDAIIMKALSRGLHQRYQTAQEMQLDLEDYLVNKGLKSNSVFLSRFMGELFATKIAARNRALQQANANNLEGVVLISGEAGPDMNAFLNMFFGDFAPTGDSQSDNSSPEADEFAAAGPRATPLPILRPTPPPTPRAAMDRDETVPKMAAQPPSAGQAIDLPQRAPPPKPPEGMEIQYPARVDGRTAPPGPAVAQDAAREQPPAAVANVASVDFPQPEPLCGSPGRAAPIDPASLEEAALAGEPVRARGPSAAVKLLGGALAVAALIGLIIFMRSGGDEPDTPLTGKIKVTSVPEGAFIYLDDQRVSQKTPAELAFIKPDKQYSLRVLIPDLPPWEQTFTLTDPGQILEFHAELSTDPLVALKAKVAGDPIIAGAEGKGSGRIRITSTPPGALIYLDGVSTGKHTPATLSGVPAELDHVVLLEKEGMGLVFSRVRVTGDEPVPAEFTLAPNPEPLKERITVRIESDPEGATVSVNGFPLRKSTPMAVAMLAGVSSELQIELKGFQSWSQTVRPIPGVDLTIFAKLKKK